MGKQVNKFLALFLVAIVVASPLHADLVIKNGGNGDTLKISGEGRAQVDATTEEELEHHSEVNGLAFNWKNVSYDYAVGDSLLCVTSNSNKGLFITDIVVGGDADQHFQIHLPATFTGAGTVVVGTNLNRGSNNVAEASAWSDETGNTQGTILRESIIKATTTALVDFHSALILEKNNSLCVDVEFDGTGGHVSIEGFFKTISN